MKRGCAGYYTPHPFYCLEGSTSREVMRESQSGTAFQAVKDSEHYLSEGIFLLIYFPTSAQAEPHPSAQAEILLTFNLLSEMKKETWKFILQTLAAILTAIATTLGVTSCMGY